MKAGSLDSAAGDSPVIEDDFNWEAYVGFGFYDFDEGGEGRGLSAKTYWRIA